MRLLTLLVTLTVVNTGCTGLSDDGSGPPDTRCTKCDLSAEQPTPKMCVGIRGNGQLIFAHFGALARIIENYGLVDGMAGGSSASISMFLTESVEINPAIYDCGDRWCSSREVGERAATLLKSLEGYVTALGDTDEALAFRTLIPIVEQVRSQGIDTLVETDPLAARDALLAILQSDDLKALVNPELVTLLQESPNPEWHARDIIDSISNAGSFSADSDMIFIRPGVIDFSALAGMVGRMASFYAGYGPSDYYGTLDFLDSCTKSGQSWTDIADTTSQDSTCGARFASLLTTYRSAWAASPPSRTRADDPVGGYVPALVSTSVLTGGTAQSWRSARDDYRAARTHNFTPDFADVKFGYWGHPYDMHVVGKNSGKFTDDKTSRFLSLGSATWREALSYSPAEPGLARALEIDADLVSAGGWSDLHPTLVLRNLGCERVVYVTRKGEESGFAQGVAGLLGMKDAQKDALYNLDLDSSFDLSLREADATWCTDWNNMSAFPTGPIVSDAYNAPLATTDNFFHGKYANASSDFTARGCTSSR